MVSEMFLILGIVAALIVGAVMLFVNRFLMLCHPNEVIVISGRSRRLDDGSRVGYRVIRGGRALRIPVMEKAARLSLETVPLNLTVKNAYSAGGIPLHVDAVANVKVASTEPVLGNAVERFLDKELSEVHQIAKETLEGNLRGVLATLTPEEVNEDRLKFAQSLIEEADQDLGQLGLKLDTLKIQNVSDEAGYLDSIGRRKTAEVLAHARKAEAEQKAEAEEAEAESQRRAEVARAEAAQQIEVAENALRIKKAELEKTAVVKEQEAAVAGEKAKARYEQELEQERIVLQQKRLMADVIEPARASREAKELEARGDSASILENGRAKVEVLERMIETYKTAAGDGERVFVLQMLPEIVRELAASVDRVTVDRVSVIDNGGGGVNGGGGFGRLVGQFPAAVIAMAEQIENATGVDLLGALGRTPSNGAPVAEPVIPAVADDGESSRDAA